MRAFHSFWSKPNSCRNNGVTELPGFELLTAMLSALEWKKHNGEIRLFTDTPGALFFKSKGMEELWDEMDLSLDEISPTVDPFFFWAAGKLYALQMAECPTAMLDTDLIIWKKLDEQKMGDITVAHMEGLNPYVYPDPKNFRFRDDYELPKSWNYSLDAANTAFLYVKDGQFRDTYVKAAKEFFEHVEQDGLNPVTAMCFAEQRILPMVASEHAQNIIPLFSLDQANAQQIATHTWGFKQVLRESSEAREEFRQRILRRVDEEFPEWLSVAERL